MSAYGPSLPSCVARLAFGNLIPGSSAALNIEFDMSDDPGVQFVGARTIKVSSTLKQRWGKMIKNTFTNGVLSQRRSRQMSHDSAEGSQHSWQSHFHPPLSRTDPRPPLLPPMNHYRHGHNNAMPRTRNPVRTESGVIDLTADPETPPRRTQPHAPENSDSNTGRLPRFGRNIMADVVDLAQESDEPVEIPSSSPEVQFVGATVRPPHARLGYPRAFHGQAPAIDHYIAFRGGHSRTLPSLHSSRTTRRIGMERLLIGEIPGLPSFDLDYGLTSFSMDPTLPAIRQPLPPEPRQRETYRAPSPPPEGFTRTLQEDDVAICPNCSCELGTGEGKKEEIWVAKPCGHVSHRGTACLTWLDFDSNVRGIGLLWRMCGESIQIKAQKDTGNSKYEGFSQMPSR